MRTLARVVPCAPSPEWFRENLTEIARRLKGETAADIGLCSLCPIGDRFHTDGVHLNSRAGRIVADRIQEFIEA